MTSKSTSPRFVLCVDNDEYEVSLELCKVYRLLSDARGEKVGLIRVIDESGEDYLYPREMFVPIELSAATSRLVARLSRLQRKR